MHTFNACLFLRFVAFSFSTYQTCCLTLVHDVLIYFLLSCSDKLCDLLADTLVDACLTVDPNAHAHIQCMVGKDMVVVSGEVTVAKAAVNYQQVVRDVLRDAGYDSITKGEQNERVALSLWGD